MFSEMSINKLKPYVAAILMQFCYAGMSIFAKFVLNKGMDHYVFVVYRHAIATALLSPFAFFLERDRPKMSFAVFWKIMLLGLLEPVIDQNLYYQGMKYTTAAFTSALCNISPTLTFLLALIVRQEKIEDRSLHSLAKVVGSLVTVGGALTMIFVKGPGLGMEQNHHNSHQSVTDSDPIIHEYVKGAIFIILGCSSWACFVILQVKTIRAYPAQLSLTAMICAAGTVEGGAVALFSNWGNSAAWIMHLDSKFLCVLYSGTICSGVAYYVQGMIMKARGPVFATSFGPLNMILVAMASVFFLHERLVLGRIIGAIVIAIGLYLVLWGKSKDPDRTRPDHDQLLPIDK